MKRLSAIIVAVFLLCSAIPVLAQQGPATGGPGLYETDLFSDEVADFKVGTLSVWNTNQEFVFTLQPIEGIKLTDVQIWAAPYADFMNDDEGDGPPVKKGKPDFGKFPHKFSLELDAGLPATVMVDMKSDLDPPVSWGGGPKHYVFLLHGDFEMLVDGEWVSEGLTADGPINFSEDYPRMLSAYIIMHPQRGQFIDSPVGGLSINGPTQRGVTSLDGPRGTGGFLFFEGEEITFGIGEVVLGTADAAKKVSPLDLFDSADMDDQRVINVARTLQSLDEDSGSIARDGKIVLLPHVVECFEGVTGGSVNWSATETEMTELLDTVVAQCNGDGASLAVISAADASDNLFAGLNAGGIFRKNISKTEEWGETKQKLEQMPVYFPAIRSNGEPSYCCIDDPATAVDECSVDFCDDTSTPDVIEQCGTPGVVYAEWRLNGDPLGEDCDPRIEVEGQTCVVTEIECRDVVKPLVVNYLAKEDIYDDQVTTAFWPDRFSYDVYTAVSRDDGNTWKRMNNSRMADMSSFELETGEPFPGTAGSPYLKVNDNQILVVWESKFCKSGNPRYSINLCDDPATEEVEADDPLTEENECAVYCRGNADNDTEVCEPDYPYDDDYYITDVWGVRGQQQSVDYDEVDDVAELGIGEIPYSCLWAQRGVIASQAELADETFASMTIIDDSGTPDDTSDDITRAVQLGDIVWYKPERLTSGRRDVYVPMIGSARGAGFAIAWQEDPSGLRPGKGKGPGEGWSGAISNHKTDIWYSFIAYDDFRLIDENFVPGGPGGGTDAEPSGDEGYLDKPGLGRPKAKVPFSLPVRITDNDMVNTNTLKVQPSADCVTLQDGADPICFPEVVDNTFVPIDPEEIAKEFCGHPEADPATCCNPDDHQGDPNCEDLKGFFGNLSGTKRYAYMAKSIDEYGYNADGDYVYMPGGDGTLDYEYYVNRGGTLDLCDTEGTNSYMLDLPGTSAHERWFGFMNVAGASKLVCVTSDGRLLDGDVFASRPMLQLQPYTKVDGTKSAWALLAYEESKGLGHALAAEEHVDTDNPVDEIIGDVTDDNGQEKPVKQDIGKNMMYHSFDFSEPDLVSPGHMVNLPALCGGIYPTYCDDPKTPDVIETDQENPTCSCTAGEPVPLYFDYLVDRDGDPETPAEWLPDDSKFLQYRTEIARRARFLVQSYGKMGDTRTAGAIIYKQGQEGQGRPADVFIRRIVVPTKVTNPDGSERNFSPKKDNPFAFENFECTTYLDQTFTLPTCPNDGIAGYNCNVWGEASGDRLCGGVFTDPIGGYPRRDHINLTSADIDLAVDAGPDDDTPDDPTDDRYGTNKVLLWSQHERNLGDESYGFVDTDGTPCAVIGLEQDPVTGDWSEVTPEVCPAMYSNARSHRGFMRGDLLVTAYSLSPNWAAGRNGNDRYNFYIRRSFDGGKTWTTTPSDLGGTGVYLCPEYRSDPNNPDPDGSGNLAPQMLLDSVNGACGVYDPALVPDGELPPLPAGIAAVNYLDPISATPDGLPAQFIAAGVFEPARNVSEIKNNHESSGDPRLGTTPPTYPLDGTTGSIMCPTMGDPGSWECIFPEDEYMDNMFFVAWGTVDNAKSTGSTGEKAEAGPLDLYYTRSENYGDSYLKIPWVIGGQNSNLGYGETVWRYDFVAKGEPEEQGEAQLKATSDGSKAYIIWHSQISPEEDPNEPYSRFYPWEPSESSENDIWFRRLIFWPDLITDPEPIE